MEGMSSEPEDTSDNDDIVCVESKDIKSINTTVMLDIKNVECPNKISNAKRSFEDIFMGRMRAL